MNRFYDAAIIGPGLGGLLVAAILSKRGARVVLWEEGTDARSASLVFKDGEFLFPKGPALSFGCEPGGPYHRIFSEIGLSLPLLRRQNDLLTAADPVLQVVLPAHRIDLSHDLSRTLSELRREFPLSGDAMTTVSRDMERLTCIRREKEARGLQGLRGLFQALLTFPFYWRTRWSDYLLRCGLDDEARQFFLVLPRVFGVHPEGDLTSASALLLVQGLFRPAVRFRGGRPRLAGLLKKIIGDHGGFMMKGGQTCSATFDGRGNAQVVTDTGETVRARHLVVSLPYKAPRVHCLYFAIDETLIPTAMKENLLLCGDDSGDGPFPPRSLLFLTMSLSGEEGAPEGWRALKVSCRVSGEEPAGEQRQRLRDAVTERLLWLMPFSEGGLHYLGDSARGGEAGKGEGWPLQGVSPPARHRPVRSKTLFMIPDPGEACIGMPEEAQVSMEIADQIGQFPSQRSSVWR